MLAPTSPEENHDPRQTVGRSSVQSTRQSIPTARTRQASAGPILSRKGLSRTAAYLPEPGPGPGARNAHALQRSPIRAGAPHPSSADKTRARHARDGERTREGRSAAHHGVRERMPLTAASSTSHPRPGSCGTLHTPPFASIGRFFTIGSSQALGRPIRNSAPNAWFGTDAHRCAPASASM
jgi:hypothetical protein